MASERFDRGRFGRLLGLIAFVTAISVMTSAETLEGTAFQISVFAIGTIALLTAMIGFLIAASAAYDGTETAN